MHGIINRFRAHPGKRDAAMALMAADPALMTGCLSFVLSRDLEDPDAFWLTEAWVSKAAWQASLTQGEVKDSIDHLSPLIADWGKTIIVAPVSGYGVNFGLEA